MIDAQRVDGRAGRRFSVVIVNYNGLDTLLAAARSAVHEGVPTDQIVVVDNGSTDPSLAQLEEAMPAAKIIRNGCHAGFARAVNRGIQLYSDRTEFMLLLNNDAELLPGALQAFALAFDQSPKLAIAGGQLRYPDGRLQSAFAPLPTLMQEFVPLNFLKWTQPHRYVRYTSDPAMKEVESVFGACLAVRAAALHAIGLLDEDFFFYYEEVDWCRRARIAKWQVRYVPRAGATHVLGHTAHRYRRDARIEMQRSKLIYFRKTEIHFRYGALSIFLAFRSGLNALSGLLGCICTLGMKRRLRTNTAAYWRVFQWHVSGRPRSWGLPGKCPQSGDRPTTLSNGE